MFWISGHLSIMGGGRLQEVVAHGGSTALVLKGPNNMISRVTSIKAFI